MTFTFYKYTDDARRIDKANYLTQLAVKSNCVFKDAENKGTPVIEAAYDANIKDANYLYIDTLGYYYLSEPVLAGQRFIFTASKDLLFTEKTNILNLECIIARQENKYNAYLNDDRFPVLNKQQVNTLAFPSGFSNTDNIVMVVNGG